MWNLNGHRYFSLGTRPGGFKPATSVSGEQPQQRPICGPCNRQR
jgi:hypothetical protein